MTPEAAAADEHVHGAGKQTKFRESAVYVDGKVVAVMRCAELPSSVRPHAAREVDGLDIPRYYHLYDYVTALGVPVAKIKAIQLYGTHGRVATIEGDELVKYKDRLVFDYTQQITGKPRARWQIHGLKHSTYIDNIFATTIYVDKDPPVYTPGHGLAYADGSPVDGIPYASEDPPKGTRVYVDGLLAGYVKRKMLSDEIIAKGSDKVFPKFSFAAFVQSLGIDAQHAKAVDLVSDDALVLRLGAAEWKSDKDSLVFVTPRHAHGKVKASLPGDKSASVSSVQLFVRTSPPARTVDPEAFDSKSGSDADQGNEASGRNDEGSGSAQSVKNSWEE